ncbi:MAG: hypothetical protein HY822_14570 [Acidobacteria bacterium]|nr:hypothetical protein [Acidobacteriota bacterium]
MAQPPLAAWKTVAAVVCAVLLGLLFLISGVWKITDPYRAATLMTQALVPHALSLPAAIGFGVGETFAAVLLLVPRYRRWGAWLTALMLVAFLAYFTIFYAQLRGQDCNCFPWVKRAVGPEFFLGDAVMLFMAIVAGWWARPSAGMRTAAIVLGAVAVFAFASFGIHAARQTGVRAPDSVTVDGRPFSLQQGRVFLYFFDPECAHCDLAARRMAKYNWGDTAVLVVPTAQPQFTGQFLQSTGLRALVTYDLAPLRQVFSFVSGPYAVALENGRQKVGLGSFEGDEPEATLRGLGFVY